MSVHKLFIAFAVFLVLGSLRCGQSGTVTRVSTPAPASLVGCFLQWVRRRPPGPDRGCFDARGDHRISGSADQDRMQPFQSLILQTPYNQAKWPVGWPTNCLLLAIVGFTLTTKQQYVVPAHREGHPQAPACSREAPQADLASHRHSHLDSGRSAQCSGARLPAWLECPADFLLEPAPVEAVRA